VSVIFRADTPQEPGPSSSRYSAGGSRQSPRSSPHRSVEGESMVEEREGGGRGEQEEERMTFTNVRESFWIRANTELR